MNRPLRSSGSVVVEFAIVLPLLMMLLLGITELGRALYQLNGLTKAATGGARYLARMHEAVNYDEHAADRCTPGTEWNTAAATNVVIYGNEAGTGEELFRDVNVSFGLRYSDVSIVGMPETSACVITAEVSMDFVSVMGDGEVLIPFSTMSTDLLPITLTANVEERFTGE